MELRSEISKQYIAEALLILMKQKDYNKISIQDIVDKAGFSRMAFYRNFKDRDDILVYYLDKITYEFITESSIDFATQTMKQAFLLLFGHLQKHLELGKLLYKSNKLHLAQAQFDKYFLLKARTEEDKFRQLYISGGTFRLYCEWIRSGGKYSVQEIAKFTEKYLQ